MEEEWQNHKGDTSWPRERKALGGGGGAGGGGQF